jgi:hypothetical protein
MFRLASLKAALVVMGALVIVGCGGGRVSQAASTPSPKATFASSTSSNSGKVGAAAAPKQTAALHPPVHVSAPTNTCAPKSDYDFLDVAACEIGRAGKSNRRINEHCGQYVSNDFSDPRCAKIIKRYQLLLRQVHANLVVVGVPTGLGAVDAALLRANRHDLQAAKTALKAYGSNNWPLFMRAWGMHGRAGQDLVDAGNALAKWLYQQAATLKG